MYPMTPLPETAGIVHDRSHFLTPAGYYTPEDLSDAGVRANRVRDLSERYTTDPGFTPGEVGVDLWQLDDSEANILGAISALRRDEFDARPVYCFGFEGHWSLEPGSEAAHRQDVSDIQAKVTEEVKDTTAIEGATLKQGSPYVAVVDAGFGASLPAAIGDAPGGEIADEQAKGVHGSFVLHLIELAAPGARIDYIAVPQLKSEFVQVSMERHWRRREIDPEEAPVICSDDLAVAMAMWRVGARMLAARSRDNHYLNLSLGTYLPETGGLSHLPGLAPMATERALDAANQHGVTVVAAAGNDLRRSSSGIGDGPAFYPACRDDVIAVGAADLNGNPIMWVHGERKTQARWWWTDKAPGIDLVGAPYDDETMEALRWSGSSFAAAVATGRLASGKSLANTGYGAVSQMCYLDADGEVTKNP